MLIEINLVPRHGGAPPRKGRPKPWTRSSRVPGKSPVVASTAVVAVAVAWIAHSLWFLEARAREVESAIGREVADSLTLEAALSEYRSLEARRDAIARRVEIIRNIDGRRYVWPRLLSEISDAMPAHAWVLEIAAAEPPDTTDPGPGFLMQGRAGSTDALTRLMKSLENSDYIHGVTLIAAEQERLDEWVVQRFSLRAAYHEPDASAITPDALAGVN